MTCGWCDGTGWERAGRCTACRGRGVVHLVLVGGRASLATVHGGSRANCAAAGGGACREPAAETAW